MGIKNFTQLLKRYAPNCTFPTHMEAFRGQNVAIDVNCLLYKHYCVIANEVLIKTDVALEDPDESLIERKTTGRLLDCFAKFASFGMNPVLCFDGKPHQLKLICLDERGGAHSKRDDRLKELKEKIRKDVLEVSDADVNEYKKLYKSSIKPSWQFVSRLMNLFDSLGFTVITCEELNFDNGDAEAICAMLSHNDVCRLSYTIDSDYHPYGGDLAILEINGENLMIRSMMLIIDEMGLTFDAFQDLCIMQGTDFNDNIKGIGPVKSWNLLEKYGSVPAIEGVDKARLKYDEVKKLFSETMKEIDFGDVSFDYDKLEKYGRHILSQYALDEHMNGMLESFSKLK